MYTLVSGIHVCLKIILIGQLLSKSVSSVGRKSSYKSQSCGFESHGEQESYILYFVSLVALLTGRLAPYE